MIPMFQDKHPRIDGIESSTNCRLHDLHWFTRWHPSWLAKFVQITPITCVCVCMIRISTVYVGYKPLLSGVGANHSNHVWASGRSNQLPWLINPRSNYWAPPGTMMLNQLIILYQSSWINTYVINSWWSGRDCDEANHNRIRLMFISQQT